jgi:hypothetical protein
MLGKTEDGVAWNDPSIDADEMNEMIWDLWSTKPVTELAQDPL